MGEMTHAYEPLVGILEGRYFEEYTMMGLIL
jgi:hypothetical protein